MEILYILLALAILVVMIIIHEFGHYIAGRLLGFKIVEFAIGLGPVLFSRKNKRGEKISVRALPLGGYCAFYGEDGPGGDTDAKEHKEKTTEAAPDQPKPLSFEQHAPWKRLIVFFAGGVFNLISGVLFAFIFLVSVPVVPKIIDVSGTPNSALLHNGDIITYVNDTEVTHLNNFAALVQTIDKDQTFSLTVIRDGQTIRINDLKKYKQVTTDENGNEQESYIIGIRLDYLHQGFLKSARDTFPFSAKMAGLILETFFGLFMGKNLDMLTGPIGTIGTVAEFSQMNILNVLVFLPLIAINLGIANLLPIPALDGSKIIFVLIEWIRGKPINRNVEAMIHFIGFILLLGLMFSADIIHFFKKI